MRRLARLGLVMLVALSTLAIMGTASALPTVTVELHPEDQLTSTSIAPGQRLRVTFDPGPEPCSEMRLFKAQPTGLPTQVALTFNGSVYRRTFTNGFPAGEMVLILTGNCGEEGNFLFTHHFYVTDMSPDSRMSARALGPKVSFFTPPSGSVSSNFPFYFKHGFVCDGPCATGVFTGTRYFIYEPSSDTFANIGGSLIVDVDGLGNESRFVRKRFPIGLTAGEYLFLAVWIYEGAVNYGLGLELQVSDF